MTYPNPFVLPGRFYRGNTHTHSTCSDGVVSLEGRCDAYRQRGYDFLVLTDHDGFHPVDHCNADGFLAIPGFEMHPANPYGGEFYHIVGLGVNRYVDGRNMAVQSVLDAIADQGGLAVLAHPYWCGHTLRDYENLRGYFALEVYNGTCCVGISKGYSEPHWDDHLDRIGPVVGLAVDDAHHESKDVFKGWVMVKAADLTAPAILNALRTGAFYSTQGPEIHDLRVDRTPQGPRLRVHTSPARRIAFKGRAYTGQCVDAQSDQWITTAECVMDSQHKYLRVEVTAPDGRKAWTNPFSVDNYL
jgi:hypothetical protein